MVMIHPIGFSGLQIVASSSHACITRNSIPILLGIMGWLADSVDIELFIVDAALACRGRPPIVGVKVRGMGRDDPNNEDDDGERRSIGGTGIMRAAGSLSAIATG